MTDTSEPLVALTGCLAAFRDARDWKRFHCLKNLMVLVSLGAGEQHKLTQWKNEAEVEALAADASFRERLRQERADVLIYLLLVCERAGIDLGVGARAKIDLKATRYPVEKARGNARKYTEL